MAGGRLFDPLMARAAADPDGVFGHVVIGETCLRYTQGELAADARAMAGRIVAAGIAPGAVVPIVLEHRAALYASFVGCTLAGMVPTFLTPPTRKQDPVLARQAMAALLARIAPGAIVASDATLSCVAEAGMAEAGAPVLNVDAAGEAAPFLPREAPEDAVFLQHSSGTTGLRKGVVLSNATVRRHVHAYARAIALRAGDVIASWLPLYHDMGLITGFLLPAELGVPVVSLDALEWVTRPTMLLDRIAEYRATLGWMPNFAFHHLVRLAEPGRDWDLSSLRMLVNCSEPCRADAFDAFAARFAGSSVTPECLQVSYAMAETVFAVTQTPPGGRVRRSTHPDYPDFLSCGPAVEGARVRVTREDGGIAASGELGAIGVGGDWLFGGYYKDAALTAGRLGADGWFATGDLGFIDGGELFVVGRGDDVLNVNGRKLLAHQVEASLAGIDDLAPGRTLVYAEYDAEIGATALAVLSERVAGSAVPARTTAGAIRHRVLATSGAVPGRIDFVPRGFLVKSSSGKISRAASLRKFREGLAADAARE